MALRNFNRRAIQARAARGRGLQAAGGLGGGFQARINLRVNRGEQASNMMSLILRKQNRAIARSRRGADAAMRRRQRDRESEETGQIFGRFGGRGLLNLSNDPHQLSGQIVTRSLTATQAIKTVATNLSEGDVFGSLGAGLPLLGATVGGPMGAIMGAVGTMISLANSVLKEELKEEIESFKQDMKEVMRRIDDLTPLFDELMKDETVAGNLRTDAARRMSLREAHANAHSGYVNGSEALGRAF